MITKRQSQRTPNKHFGLKPLEMPIFPDPDETSDRFVSSKAMYQVRLKILKQISARMKGEFYPNT